MKGGCGGLILRCCFRATPQNGRKKNTERGCVCYCGLSLLDACEVSFKRELLNGQKKKKGESSWGENRIFLRYFVFVF